MHGYGNVFEKQLDAGESIDIEPGGWVYRDHSVQMSQEVYGFKTGFLSGGGGNLVFNRFTGPGRVGLQSAYFHPPVSEGAGGNAQREGGGGLVGGLVRGVLDTPADGPMTHPTGHLSRNPLPPGIVGALGLGGYQLLADVGGVGAGRLGPQAFLLIAPDPDPNLPDAGTQIALAPKR